MASSNVPHSHRPITTGEGFYALNSPITTRLIRDHENLFKEIAGNFDGKGCFVICEYGASDGGPQGYTYKAVIDEIRRIHDRRVPIELILEDQATNDWETVFKLYTGTMPALHSPLSDIPDLYLYGSGRGFFDAVCPPGKVHLGMASTCTHWLSKKPCDPTDSVYSILTGESEAKEMFRNQAREDWETFLLRRSAELAPGGHFILMQLAYDSEYSENIQNKSGNYGYPAGYIRMMNNTWKQMVEEGDITQEELKSTTMVDWYRSIREVKGPFEDENSAVRRSGLELKQINYAFAGFPSIQELTEQDASMSDEAYIDLFVKCVRAWSDSTFYDGLSNARSQNERRDIIDKFYKKIAKTVAANRDCIHDDLITVAVFVKSL